MQMPDVIEHQGQSRMQHGPLNDRIYLMKLDPVDFPGIVSAMEDLAHTQSYSKIFAKVPEEFRDSFLEYGYLEEGRVPRFYEGQKTAVFVSKFLASWRGMATDQQRIQDVLAATEAKQADAPSYGPSQLQAVELGPEHAGQTAHLYDTVFDSYPFPIYDPAYIRETMHSHVRYFGVFDREQLVALASSEIDTTGQNVEMTDFATAPEYRSKGLAGFLLAHMETVMREAGLYTAYTIARAVSYGMNITFARAGYVYGGTLINNTNIAGNLESMNIWYKHLGNP